MIVTIELERNRFSSTYENTKVNKFPSVNMYGMSQPKIDNEPNNKSDIPTTLVYGKIYEVESIVGFPAWYNVDGSTRTWQRDRFITLTMYRDKQLTDLLQ